MSDKARANSTQDPEAEFATSVSPPAIVARGLVKTCVREGLSRCSKQVEADA